MSIQPTSVPIDFVVTWVDGNDPKWLAKRAVYATTDVLQQQDVGGDARFDSNELFRYWFRGVEKFAPWVNKVHLVTEGHLPLWLNVDCPKLNIVKHEEFIPSQYLPLFNSSAILLHIPLIHNLSEQFVLFNDDMFLIDSVTPAMFFRKGLPCDMAALDIIATKKDEVFWHNILNDITVINRIYPKRNLSKQKFFSPRNGLKAVVKNVLLWPFSLFPGFYEPHIPNSYLKSFALTVLEKLNKEVAATSRHRFRSPEDITEWVYKFAQLATGNFSPMNKDKKGRYCSVAQDATIAAVLSQRYPLLCINDTWSAIPSALSDAFSALLPSPSCFERNMRDEEMGGLDF